MDLRRLRPAEWLLTVAAVALVVALFLPWYAVATGNGHPVSGGWTSYAPTDPASLTFTGWQAFTVVDVILALCAGVALIAVVLQGTQRSPALPIVSSVAATWAGIIATVLVVVKLLDPPLDGSVSLRAGAWVGLGAAVALLLAGWWAMRDERPGLVRSTHLESSG
jgi:hypothetical protein